MNTQAFETVIFPMTFLRPKIVRNHIRTFSQERPAKERYLSKPQGAVKKSESKQNARGEHVARSLRCVGAKTIAGTALRSPVCANSNVIVLSSKNKKRYASGESTNNVSKDSLANNFYKAIKVYTNTSVNKTFDFTNTKKQVTRRENTENELQIYKSYELTEDVLYAAINRESSSFPVLITMRQ